jgi:hypothetical protein
LIIPALEFAFTVRLVLRPAIWLRPTAVGAERAAVYLESGDFEGPAIRGRVLPASGADWALMRPDGVIDFDARYMLEADDGTPIYIQNRGFRWGDAEVMAAMARHEPVDPSRYYMRTAPKFEAPKGPHDWLNRHVFVGAGEKTPDGNQIHYFKVL